jgi:hypothetical protein
VGIRLFIEVLDYAPDTLTWRERHALSVLAENANDNTRECWPGIEEDPTIAHRMRLPARSSRYEVMKALREKKALESVTAGHRGHRAVYRIPALGPAKGPGTTDPNEEKGSGNHGQSVRETQTQSAAKGPETPDPKPEKGSGNDPERVREPHGKGPGNPDPFPSLPSTPHEEASTVTPIDLKLFGEFWLTYPKSRNKEATLAAWRSAIADGADPKQIIAATQAYAREKQGEDFRYIKHSVNWLRERRYEDRYAPEPGSRPPLRAVAGGWTGPNRPHPATGAAAPAPTAEDYEKAKPF